MISELVDLRGSCAQIPWSDARNLSSSTLGFDAVQFYRSHFQANEAPSVTLQHGVAFLEANEAPSAAHVTLIQMTSQPETLPELFDAVKDKFPASLEPERWYLVAVRKTTLSMLSTLRVDLPVALGFCTGHMLRTFPAWTTVHLPDKLDGKCFFRPTSLPQQALA